MASLTVTGTLSASASVGTTLTVDVLTGAKIPASQNGGIFQSEEATHPPGGTSLFNAVGSNSWLYGCASWGPNTAVGSIITHTTVILTFSNTNLAAAAFRNSFATLTIGSSTGVDIGGTTPTTVAGEFVVAEILAATGQSIGLDGSTPATVTSNTALSISTASFSPPPGSLLVATVTGYDGGAGVIGSSISDSLGLSWTTLVSRATAGNGVASIFIAQVPSSDTQRPVLPGQTWLRRFSHKQAPFQTAPTTTPVTLSGTVSAVSVDAPIGGRAPDLVSPVNAAPGPTWKRAFQHKQLKVPNSNTILFGTTASIAVSSQFADETATVSPQGIASAVSVAVTGETLLTSITGTVANIAVSSPAGTMSESDSGVTATINVSVPAQTILESISGSVSTVNVDAPAGQVVFFSSVGQQAQPGATWRRFFQHRQKLQAPVVPGNAVAGITAQVSVAALSGSISTGAGGTVSTVSVSGITGTISSSVSATATISVASQGSVSSSVTGTTGSISVAGIAGSIARTLAGTTSVITVAGLPGSIVTGSGLLGTTAAVTVAALTGSVNRTLSGNPASIIVSSVSQVSITLNGVVSTSSVAAISGSVVVSQAGKNSAITVTATPGLTGRVIITGEEWTPLVWKGSLVVRSSGKGVPIQWSGSVVAG